MDDLRGEECRDDNQKQQTKWGPTQQQPDAHESNRQPDKQEDEATGNAGDQHQTAEQDNRDDQRLLPEEAVFLQPVARSAQGGEIKQTHRGWSLPDSRNGA